MKVKREEGVAEADIEREERNKGCVREREQKFRVCLLFHFLPLTFFFFCGFVGTR